MKRLIALLVSSAILFACSPAVSSVKQDTPEETPAAQTVPAIAADVCAPARLTDDGVLCISAPVSAAEAASNIDHAGAYSAV